MVTKKPVSPSKTPPTAEVVEQPEVVNETEQIEQALDRKTDDGPGNDPMPPSDFESYATVGVEKERRPLVSVVQEVLDGAWGDYTVRRQRLTDAGYDPTEVQTLVNLRLVGGAPNSHPASAEEILAQVERGEWGPSDEKVQKNLDRAGYTVSLIKFEADHSRGE